LNNKVVKYKNDADKRKGDANCQKQFFDRA